MAGAAVVVTPPTTSRRQQLIDGIKQITIASRPGFDDGHTSGGVGSEYREQSVTSALCESGDVTCHIRHLRVIPGPDGYLYGLHPSNDTKPPGPSWPGRNQIPPLPSPNR